jgi:hypothetical protein
MTEHITISVHPGMKVLIDAADADLVASYCWYAFRVRRVWYVASDDKGYRIYLHRLLMNAPEGMEVDHINGDGLDNRRCNLRVCTHEQNLANQRHQLRATYSPYKGVTWCKRTKRWRAQIKAHQQHVNLGTFTNERDAAIAYNRAAREAWGEYARLNDVG